jgi:hypothetical protein
MLTSRGCGDRIERGKTRSSTWIEISLKRIPNLAALIQARFCSSMAEPTAKRTIALEITPQTMTSNT